MAEGEGRTGLVALPVAVLLLAMLTVWVVVFSREEGTAEPDDLVAATTTPSAEPAELAQLWRAPAVTAAIDDAGLRATRLWAHDGTVTLVSTAGVTGYDTVDGTALWQAATPPGAGAPCAAAERTNAEGVGALLYRQDGSCSVLGVIDTTSGALLWSAPLDAPEQDDVPDDAAQDEDPQNADPQNADPQDEDPQHDADQDQGQDTGQDQDQDQGQEETDQEPGARDAADVSVTVGELTVTVTLDRAGGVSAFHRFTLDDGTELGLPPPPADPAQGCAEEDRTPESAWHAGSRVAVLSRCGETAELSVHNADTGELEWTHPADGDPEFGFSGILAGDPVMLFQDDELVAYGETGEELWRRPVGELRPEMSAVAGGVLCVREGQAAFTGFDVAAGERHWETDLPSGTQLFGVQDERLLLGRPAEGEVLQLTLLDPADGTETPAGSVPLDPRRAGEARFVAWDEHQLYVMAAVRGDGDEGLRLRAFER